MGGVILKDWSIGGTGGPYTPPECRLPILMGTVYGHPNYPYIIDGEFITTSPVKKANGRTVETRNNVYELVGPPAKGYVEFMEKLGKPFDPDDPFKGMMS